MKRLQPISFYLFQFFIFWGTVFGGIGVSQSKSDLTIWYDYPASVWDEALPVGNGRMGAMVYGQPEKERVQFNEESLWAGNHIDINNPGGLSHLKEIQQLLLNGDNAKAYELSTRYLLSIPPRLRSYQTFGDVLIDMGNLGLIKHYRRELNLETGAVTIQYEAEGIRYKRRVFASAPQNCIIIQISVDQPGKLNCKINLTRERDVSITTDGVSSLLMTGQIMDVPDSVNGPGGTDMRFSALLTARNETGVIKAVNNSLLVEDATSLTLLLTAATDYNFSNLNFDPSIDPRALCQQVISQAKNISGKNLFQNHLNEYQPVFNRVSFSLSGEDHSSIPTDKRMEELKRGNRDDQLIPLYFQFGRYLLMSSSRAPGKLPANLQGIWNELYNAPWNSDYHTNINLQMNYWPAETANLSETVNPLIQFINNYRIPGRETAKELYGAQGWTMHHATDVFGKTGIVDGIQWGTSPLSAAWLCTHLWEHYLFTGDKDYLQETAWPIMKEAAEFVQNFLIKDHQGRLVTAPSMSPENTFVMADGTRSVITYSPTIDVEIIQAFYNDCIEAASILKTEKQFIDSLKNTLKQIPPIQISKRYNIVQEWIEDYEESEPGHRHISQLTGLYPFNIINPETADLFRAANRTIQRRLAHGGGQTGWSRAWMINFYARLLDGENAYANLIALLQKSTLSNLFNSGPPFQIDGNFGGAAGIAEMLIQSQNGAIQLLPALPKSWGSGRISGLVTRGAFVVGMDWDANKLQKVNIYSRNGGDCVIQFRDKTVKLKTKRGRTYEINEW